MDKNAVNRKRYIIVAIVFIVILLLFVIKRRSPSKPRISGELASRSTINVVEPVVSSQSPEENDTIVTSDNDGIISFEMRPAPVKVLPKKYQSLSKTQIIESIVAAVSGVSDDMTAKNVIINRVFQISFNLTGAELLQILNAAHIEDEFYRFNVIKGVAPKLSYPLTDNELRKILGLFSDDNYKYKSNTVLLREQMKSE